MSYGIENLDFHFGIGWGTLNGSNKRIKNPFSYLNDSFLTRPSETEDFGGQFQPSRYFSGADASPFYGLSYVVNDRLLLKLERDTTLTDGMMQYDSPKFDYTYGFEYNFNKNFVLGFYHERGNNTSFKFTYKKDASSSSNVNTKYKKIERQDNTSSVDYLINTLESNGIGVNKVVESAKGLGIEVTQFSLPNLNLIEEIIYVAKKDANIEKDIKYQYRTADLKAYSEYDDDFLKDSKLLYERKKHQILIHTMNLP